MGKFLASGTLHCVSISQLFTSDFNAFSLFEQPSLKVKFLIIKISSKFIVSLSFVQKILNHLNTYREMINSVILVSGRAAVDKKASYVPI